MCTAWGRLAKKVCQQYSFGPIRPKVHKSPKPRGPCETSWCLGAEIISPLSRDSLWLAITLAQFVSQNASRTVSPPQERAFFLFQNYPRSEGNCKTTERRKLCRGIFCPAASGCLFWPAGKWVRAAGPQKRKIEPKRVRVLWSSKMITHWVLLFARYYRNYFPGLGRLGNIYRNSRESTENKWWQPALRGTPRITGLAPVRIIYRKKLQDRASFELFR